MDYAAHYNRLIERARTRSIVGYSERHHVLPRCMGGTDDPLNIARLTGEEHYVAHQLLVKMHPGNHRLVWALSAMTGAPPQMARPKNKRYGWLRRLFAETIRARNTGRKASVEARANMSAAAKARVRRPHTAEARANMSAATKGKPKSAAHIAASAKARTGVRQGRRSDQGRANLAAAAKRTALTMDYYYLHTPEVRAARSAGLRLWWAARRAQPVGG